MIQKVEAWRMGRVESRRQTSQWDLQYNSRFVCLGFNRTFSTNMLYCVIKVEIYIM